MIANSSEGQLRLAAVPANPDCASRLTLPAASSVEAAVALAAGTRSLSEPFNLPNTADRGAAGSHKERPQRPMTAFSAQAQRPPPTPLVNRPLFLLERKDGGVRGNARNSSPSVGEAGSTHQSKAVSARGGHPEVSHPPGRLLSGPTQEAGEHLLDVSDLVSIKELQRIPQMCLWI